jgi:hypothetical protein
MENEILWRWELLCDEFENARHAYINSFEPIINNAKDGIDSNHIIAQLINAEGAWKNWVEIQNKIKKFVNENT